MIASSAVVEMKGTEAIACFYNTGIQSFGDETPLKGLLISPFRLFSNFYHHNACLEDQSVHLEIFEA